MLGVAVLPCQRADGYGYSAGESDTPLGTGAARTASQHQKSQ